MNEPKPQQTIKSIYQMLFEMATGNLTFRLEPGVKDEELNQLIILLNQLAEKIRITLRHQEYVSPHYTYQGLVQITFILDKEFVIKNCNSNVQNLLGHEVNDLLGRKMSTIIATQSIAIWESTIEEATCDANFHSTVQLIFLTSNKLYRPSFCTISRLFHSEHIIISSITTILQDIIYHLPPVKANQKKKSKIDDAETMQQLYDYILKNLEEPLPTLKQLSVLFRTNEFELKSGFRTFFNTSIHHFYNEERLKKAHLMILQSDESLKTIAFACGFTNYNNFYKAFKKRFNYSPTSLQRNNHY